MSVARIYRNLFTLCGADLNDLDYEQSADTMYLAHIGHPPTKLTRQDHTDWAFRRSPSRPP
jgi:hypothetical protein